MPEVAVAPVTPKVAYERHRRRQQAYGRWEPFTDAAPARTHVRWLGTQGIGWMRAAALAGVPEATVSKLLYGMTGRPPSLRIRPQTAAALLAVRPSLDTAAPKAIVDAAGTRRRVQALAAAGYPLADVARRIGRRPEHLRVAITGSRVTAATARAVRALYDELWDVPPDESTPVLAARAGASRKRAQEHGWPPPAAWDDYAVDNPEAGPADGWQRESFHGGQSAAGLAEDALELLGRHYTRAEAADRLGVKRNTLDKAIERVRRRSESEEQSDAA